jgi:uncharacterized protein (DUF362 family)
MQNNSHHNVYICEFKGWKDSVFRLLHATSLISQISEQQKQVLIKPNLVSYLPPPITTPVEIVEVVVDYIREYLPDIEIVIGEGSGDVGEPTTEIARKLGYLDLAQDRSVRFVDLNEAEVIHVKKSGCVRWTEMYLPEIIFDSFLISVPTLKAHTLADVTFTMKNMIGAAPPAFYQQSAHWKKSAFHSNAHYAIFELNNYRCPDFSVIDATVGMKEAHLRGPVCDPQPNLLLAGFDPVAVDACASEILKRDWKQIDYISMANGRLGQAVPEQIIQVS